MILNSNKLEERTSPKLIVRKKDQDVLEVEMFHVIRVGKTNAEYNFSQYLNALMEEFRIELSRTLYPALGIPATVSHQVELDPEEKIVAAVNDNLKE